MSITIQDVAGITANIGLIRSNSAAVQQLVHETAVSVLSHVHEHGDTTLAVRLVNAMSSGSRREGLAAWFLKFSGRQMKLAVKEGQWSCELTKGWNKDLFDLEGSELVDYGDLTKEKPTAKQMDLSDLVKALKKFVTNDKKLDNGQPVVPADVVVAAQRAMAAIVGG